METKRIRTRGNEGRCTKQRSKQKYTKKRTYHGKKKQQPPQQESVVVVEDVPVVEDENVLDLNISIVEEEQDLPHTKQTLSETKVVDIDESGTLEDLWVQIDGHFCAWGCVYLSSLSRMLYNQLTPFTRYK